jgi:hypothetical protein
MGRGTGENNLRFRKGARMSRVLIWLPEDLLERLRVTLLWRPEIERLLVSDEESLVRSLRDRRPRLLVLDGRRPEVPDLIRRIRADPETRGLSVAALIGDEMDPERSLRDAGANTVLSKRQSEPLWDDAFQELVNVPPRRWVDLRVQVALGPRPAQDAERLELVARNISVRGVLVETARPLPLGSVINLFVKLPASARDLHLVGRVVWERYGDAGVLRQGIEFLGFHGDALGSIATFVAATGASPMSAAY